MPPNSEKCSPNGLQSAILGSKSELFGFVQKWSCFWWNEGEKKCQSQTQEIGIPNHIATQNKTKNEHQTFIDFLPCWIVIETVGLEKVEENKLE